jgi:hypothetical protein
LGQPQSKNQRNPAYLKMPGFSSQKNEEEIVFNLNLHFPVNKFRIVTDRVKRYKSIYLKYFSLDGKVPKDQGWIKIS